MSYRVHLKTDAAHLELTEVLQRSPLILLGVSADAETTLRDLGIATVYDLSLSTIFANAARVVLAATVPGTVTARHGSLPSDVIDSAQLATPLTELPAKPVSYLVGIGPPREQRMQLTLSVKSIRDLALWPPYLAAKRLVTEALSPDSAPGFDPEAPMDLLPQTGQLATQRVGYTSTVLIESKPSQARPWDGTPLDITSLDQIGFGDVAFGAILSYSQTWTPKAVALGQLLHSLPLAPGESTRMTVVDWSRRVAASTTEEIAQTERLSESMSQSTSISEVTSSVAEEFQEGSSHSGSVAGSATAAGAGVPVIPTPGPPGLIPLPVMGAASVTTEAAAAATYTVSSGTRSVAAESLQNIESSTRQNSALSRSRRASILSEVSESESETINTRVVINNNHMHALSLQYYEVVQAYETEVRLRGIERAIFIPMRLVNFRREKNIRRYLPILIRFALDRRTRELLLQFRRSVVVEVAFDRFAADALAELEAQLNQSIPDGKGGEATAPFALPPLLEKVLLIRQLRRRIRSLRQELLANYSAAQRKRVLENFDRNELSALTFDRTTRLRNVAWETDRISRVVLRQKDGDVITLDETGNMTVPTAPLPVEGIASSVTVPPPETQPNLAGGVLLDTINSLAVRLIAAENAAPSDYEIVNLHVLLERRDRFQWVDLSFVASHGQSGNLTVVNLHPPVDVNDIEARLMENQLHYSQKIWLFADRQTLLMQLAGFAYTFDSGPTIRLIDFIDPAPISVAGNYVAFRFTYEADAPWQQWKTEQTAAAKPAIDVVPMPTGGVFAEAVLGEFNSAEKLDISRFWKWQDSKIPDMAPQIDPTEAGLHSLVSAPSTGSFPASLLAVREPTPLPGGLVTTEKLLAAVTAAKIFRDMSGAEITGRLLAASQKAAREGDRAAMEQANKTLGQIFDAMNGVAKSFVQSGPQLMDTAKGLGMLLNMTQGGGTAAGAAGAIGAGGASGAAGAGAAAGIAGVAETLGPLIAQAAPLLIALV